MLSAAMKTRLEELDQVEVHNLATGQSWRGVVAVGRENAARIDFLDFTFDYKELPIKVLVKRPRRLFAFGTTVRRLYSHSVVVSTPETLLPFERREEARRQPPDDEGGERRHEQEGHDAAPGGARGGSEVP